MFCFQCEQTAKGTGCTIRGVCGKAPDVAELQDLLVQAAKLLAATAVELGRLGVRDPRLDKAVSEALFSTVTNVNFDPERLRVLIRELIELKREADARYEQAARDKGVAPKPLPAGMDPAAAGSVDALLKLWSGVSIESRRERYGEDISSLMELATYGLKGMCAYLTHARILGQEDEKVYEFLHEALGGLLADEQTVDALLGLCLKVGEVNVRVMELLDLANTGAYGDPEPTEVRVTPVKGKAILVSGHDLKDLEELLKQTEGRGINIYTHGEMLPANAYPGLKKYKHLVGNFGSAWQWQQREFEEFPGAILMTTNCIQKPGDAYMDHLFTAGLVAWPGVRHVASDDFGPLIQTALDAPGFEEDAPEQKITTGFGRGAVLGVADKVIEAVKSGAIRRFLLIGGCDGVKSGRSYYTDLAKAAPDDTVILTLACGKYRFNKLEFGDIGGIPRLLDVGQCNDAYSAVRIAMALADAFDTDVNGLPLSLILSWYEQKAVAILLSLLHLGIRDMRLGPSLPAFVPPNVLQVLVDKFDIKPISTVEEDLEAILG